MSTEAIQQFEAAIGGPAGAAFMAKAATANEVARLASENERLAASLAKANVREDALREFIDELVSLGHVGGWVKLTMEARLAGIDLHRQRKDP